MTTRRRRQQYLFASVLAAIAIVNLLFFFILYRPTRNDYFNLQSSISALNTELRTRQNSVTRLERVSAQLGRSEQDRRELLTHHFVTRTAGFAEIMPVLDSMVQRSGVRNSRKDYAIDELPQYGLYSVKIRFGVQGGYPSVVNFIKDLEKSETFFITNSIDVRSTGGQLGSSGTVDLTLALETFFYQ